MARGSPGAPLTGFEARVIQDEKTALQLAYSGEHKEIVDKLLAAGAGGCDAPPTTPAPSASPVGASG
jgi:hypothetical protein